MVMKISCTCFLFLFLSLFSFFLLFTHHLDADRRSAMFREWKTSCSKNNRSRVKRSINGKLRKCKLTTVEKNVQKKKKNGHIKKKRKKEGETNLHLTFVYQHHHHHHHYHHYQHNFSNNSKEQLSTHALRCHFLVQLLKPHSMSCRSLMSTLYYRILSLSVTLLALISLATCQERSKTLYIAGFFPTSREIPQGSIGRGVLPAVKLALQHVNESPLFTKYKLDLVWNNTKVGYIIIFILLPTL